MKITDEMELRAGKATQVSGPNFSPLCSNITTLQPNDWWKAMGRVSLEFWAPILRDGLFAHLGALKTWGSKEIDDFFDSLLAKPDPAIERAAQAAFDSYGDFHCWQKADEDVKARWRKAIAEAVQKAGE